MDLREKKVLVFGSGISGIAAGRLLVKQGADVILYDGNASLDAGSIRKEILTGQTEGADMQVVLGELPQEILDTLSLTVMSPGVPTDLAVVGQMREKDIPIWGEIELAYVFGKGDVLAITGTNGKTTTTALLGEIMKNYRESTFVVGNIGNKGRISDCCGDEQFPAGNHTYIPPAGECDSEYFTGPSEPSSYDGSLYWGKAEYCKEPDGRRYMCFEL